MIKRLSILPVLLIILMVFAGCGGEDSGTANTYTLRIEVEGEGAVTPPEGSHRYERNSTAALKASPAEGWQFKEWVGAVDDTGSKETAVHMDGDKTVKAVFTANGLTARPPDNEPAQVHLIIKADGFRSEFFAWNCSGLEGEWQLQSEFEMIGYGVLQGESTFTMPPRPESGSWDSLPFNYSMEGTLYIEGGTVDITNIYENVVFTIIETDGPTMMDFRGTGTTTVLVKAPGVPPVQRSESYPLLIDVPLLVVFERHPECD